MNDSGFIENLNGIKRRLVFTACLRRKNKGNNNTSNSIVPKQQQQRLGSKWCELIIGSLSGEYFNTIKYETDYVIMPDDVTSISDDNYKEFLTCAQYKSMKNNAIKAIRISYLKCCENASMMLPVNGYLIDTPWSTPSGITKPRLSSSSSSTSSQSDEDTDIVMVDSDNNIMVIDNDNNGDHLDENTEIEDDSAHDNSIINVTNDIDLFKQQKQSTPLIHTKLRKLQRKRWTRKRRDQKGYQHRRRCVSPARRFFSDKYISNTKQNDAKLVFNCLRLKHSMSSSINEFSKLKAERLLIQETSKSMVSYDLPVHIPKEKEEEEEKEEEVVIKENKISEEESATATSSSSSSISEQMIHDNAVLSLLLLKTYHHHHGNNDINNNINNKNKKKTTKQKQQLTKSSSSNNKKSKVKIKS